jgi:hypothetical protein
MLQQRHRTVIPYLVGIALSIVVALFARAVGLDRDRAFYPTVMIVIALYYVLFAAMSGSGSTVLLESLFAITLFVIPAVIGFKSSLWIVAAALAGHGVFDIFHGQILENSGVPVFWPAFCSTYDLGAAAILAWLIKAGPNRNDAGTTSGARA